MNQTIHHLLTGQLASWETARNNYAALSGVRVKELNVNGILYKVQFNPARIVSSGAKVDAKSILERIGPGDFFDAIADGADITHSKPDPD